jgi:Cu2+-exporting ATPase
VFVIVVTILAFIVLFVWAPRGWGLAASHATSLLIVACPCALALATPLAIAVSIGRAAKRRLLIRDGSSLQELAKPGTIWFDKTGTLTEGRPRAELVFGNDETIRWAAAIQRDCHHPTAEAILAYAGADATAHLTADDVTVHRRGVTGVVAGHDIAVGSVAFIQSQSAALSDAIDQSVNECLAAGASPVVVAVDGHACCVLGVSDPIKPDAADVIADLRSMGYRVGILSGDHCEIVDRVAAKVGVDPEMAIGGMSPEDKLAVVRREKQTVALKSQTVALKSQTVAPETESGQTVIMVGDGANDAAALAAADVGIAVRGGAEVSLQAAPIFVASGGLDGIADLVRGARRTSWLIRTAFAVSLGYNVIAVALAMAGQISPLIAAILMPASSVSVLSLVLAWPTFSQRKTAKERST